MHHNFFQGFRISKYQNLDLVGYLHEFLKTAVLLLKAQGQKDKDKNCKTTNFYSKLCSVISVLLGFLPSKGHFSGWSLPQISAFYRVLLGFQPPPSKPCGWSFL